MRPYLAAGSVALLAVALVLAAAITTFPLVAVLAIFTAAFCLAVAATFPRSRP